MKDRASAILISCSDPARTTSAIDNAVERGVPVMTFDSDAAESKRFAFYGVDDEKLGQAVMRELASQIRKKVPWRSSRGTLVGAYNHAETPADAATEVSRAQAANPQIRGWAMVGGWALSTPRLLQELDPKKVTVVAVNALPAQLPFVENGVAPVLLALRLTTGATYRSRGSSRRSISSRRYRRSFRRWKWSVSRKTILAPGLASCSLGFHRS